MATASEMKSMFERDVEAYLKALPKLLNESHGKFVLVGHAELVDVYDTREEAMARGYEQFGLRGFLVQEISSHDLEMSEHIRQECPS